MAETTRHRWYRHPAIKVGGVVVTLGLVVTGAVIARGYDSQQVHSAETSVWVVRTSGQYARYNAALKQLDTVQEASNPASVAQVGSTATVFTDGLRKSWAIDPANPAALTSGTGAGGAAASANSSTTPSGTKAVVTAGTWIGYLTDNGRVYVANLAATGGTAKPTPIDPLQADGSQGGNTNAYVADDIAVDDTGRFALYSAAEHGLRQYNAATATFTGGLVTLNQSPASDASCLLTLASGTPVLADPSAGRMWVGGDDPINVQIGANAVAGVGNSASTTALFADSSGLVSVNTRAKSSQRTSVNGGTPAAPQVIDGTTYAAWLAPTQGTLWSSTRGTTTLTVPNLTGQIGPVIATNGDRGVLEDRSSGQLWSIPDGQLVPVTQWTTAKQSKDPAQEATNIAAITQEEPPVAKPDAFGVRAGSLAALPVLLNDHDPNQNDVLTVDPQSISGGLADPHFGTVSLTNNNQTILVAVKAKSGSTTFTYSATDGQLTSSPTTVTLTVVPDASNATPAWCGVPGCLRTWPTVSLAPGGFAQVDVLTGWVDPDGDPVMLKSATPADPNAPLTVVPTADGTLAIRHTDPNAPTQSLNVNVVVSDTRGATTTRQLTVQIATNPELIVNGAALVAGVGQTKVFTVADHVTGGSGSYQLVNATVVGGNRGSVSVVSNPTNGALTLSGTEAGDSPISYTVQDTHTQATQTGMLRLTLVQTTQQITIPPLTAFVRPHQDTTLDILPAVQTTSPNVLAVESATTTDPNVSVSVVDGAQLRLSGTTADGTPGFVGTATVTVTDGVRLNAITTVTVFLVDPTTGTAPIAVPDRATVRAGGQVNIPVTANDIAPRGEKINVDPKVQGSGAPGELAFVAGDTVRYVAPSQPGTYTLTYSIFLSGNPARLDTAPITVTVLPNDTNHPPAPPTLSGRVTVGDTVSIPVPTTGTDPDGDHTVLQSVSQPPNGTGAASITGDGTAIVVSAIGATGGQTSFTYTLRDPQGATGTGTVNVAVINAGAIDPAPITYTDAASSVKDASTPITLQPLDNDRDPSGGTLQLVSVAPDAAAGTPEFTRLKGLIDPGTDLGKGIVKLKAGSVEGVQSFVYTVKSLKTGSTAEGLLVVTVTATPGPDVPQITDTVLGLANRGTLSDGVDVVTNQVRWATGDVSTLTLSVWGDAANTYRVNGNRIEGPVPNNGAVVPFALTGKNATGQQVTGYGFLWIPPLDSMRVQLRIDVVPHTVDEDKSVTVSVSDAVLVGANDTVEVQGSQGLPGLPVQRAHGSCTVQGTNITYSAGRGAPWQDTCTVQVRVTGQHTWSAVAIPFTIVPNAAQPQLNPLALTIAPGVSQTVDLYQQMTTWNAGRAGDPNSLTYTVSYSRQAFTVVQSGHQVTITAATNATPGTQERATVHVAAFGGLSAAISLTVGLSSADRPRGATLSKVCTVTDGTCPITVTGLPGEYDPFAGKPNAGLTLVAVGDAQCQVASFSITDKHTIGASFPSGAKPKGGVCVVPLTVADAQGRTGTGSVTVTVRGFPGTPASLSTVSYTGSSVTLLVKLGDAALASPALTGVKLYENGVTANATCNPAAAGTSQCVVSRLQNGQRHLYTARAANSVGESGDTSALQTWAYQAPTLNSLTATAQYDNTQTTQTQGVVQLTVGTSNDTKQFQIVDDQGTTYTDQTTGTSTTVTHTFPVAQSRTITVTPVSAFTPPPSDGGTGSTQGNSRTVSTVVPGTPYFTSPAALKSPANTIVILQDFVANRNYAPLEGLAYYSIWKSTDPRPTPCNMNTQDGVGGWTRNNGTTNAQPYQLYYGQVCYVTAFGAAASNTPQAWTTSSLPGAGNDGDVKYTIRNGSEQQGPSADTGGYSSQVWRYYDTNPPQPPVQPGFTVYYQVNGGAWSSTFTWPSNAASLIPTIYWRQCLNADPTQCGSQAKMGYTNAPSTVKVWLIEQEDASSPTNTCTLYGDSRDVGFNSSVVPSYDVAVIVDTKTRQGWATYNVQFLGDFARLQAPGPRSRPLCTGAPNPAGG